ncbi:ATP-binding protein [Rariglobus hedericola]
MFVGVVVLVATIVVSAVLHFRAMHALQAEVQDKLMRTAMAIAAQIDGDAHRTFTETAQESTPAYAAALKPLADALYWKQDGRPLRTDYRYIYTCIMKENGDIFFVLDPTPPGQLRPDGVEEKSHIMQPYPGASKELLLTLRTGQPQADREPYSDQWGTFVSGYAPFYDSAGKQVGAVGVDWQAETYAARLSGIRRAWYLQMFLCLVSGFLSGVGTGMALVRRERAEAARRHAIEEERRNRERWQIMVETLPKPAVHLQGDVFWINEPLLKSLGYRRDELASLDAWFTRLFGERATEARANYEADREGGFLRSRELNLRTAGGEMRCYEVASHAYKPGEVWLLEDITERKAFQTSLIAAREEAEAAVQAKSAFLATVSHEIRTPMNGVIGMTNLLLESPLESHQREMAETIRNSGEALVVVINDILDYSKIEAGGMEIESEPFDLRACVEDCLDLFAGLATEKRLQLLYTLPWDAPGIIHGDRLRVRQVLCNLIGNAIKFTERGEIEVRVEFAEGASKKSGERTTLRFLVRDTGIGIRPDRMNRLFRDFSQADVSTARKYGGTGLGLAISRRLVELMGGVISVESTPGEGATFFFTLPALIEPLEYSDADVEAPGSLRGAQALVVSAGAGIDEQIIEPLRRAGVQCVVVATIAQARERLKTDATAEAGSRLGDWNLVLIDAALESGDVAQALCSEVNALAVAQALKTQAVVVSTLLTVVREPARETGVARWSDRPLRAPALWRMLAELIDPKAPAEVSAPARTEPRPVASAAALAQEKPLRILVAEDNQVNRLVARRLFERFGYGIDMVANGHEALRAVQDRIYDVIFIDVQMPELNGYQVTAHIRESLPAERVPWIVALTANARDEDREECLRRGMNDYVSKPINVVDLERALRAVRKK